MREHDDGAPRVLRVLLVASFVAFAASVQFRPERGVYNVWLDVGLYNVTFVLAGYACWRQMGTGSASRNAWRAVGDWAHALRPGQHLRVGRGWRS